jgi:hypothetical protein
MKLSDDAKRSFSPEKLGFKRIGGGRKSYSSNDAREAYMLITPQKSGNRQIDACRIIISHDIADRIINSLGERVAVSLNDTGSLMLSSGNDRQLSEQGKHDRRISLDSFAPLFMKVGGFF